MTRDIDELRADIPALGETTYLNWGATGPSPKRVIDAQRRYQREQERTAHADGNVYPSANEVFENARERVAAFVGARDDEIALTTSTADGINRVASALDWTEDDVVVTTDLEHPAGRLPWHRLETLDGVETRVIQTERGRIPAEELARSLEGATLLCLSAVDWKYGRYHPVTEIVEKAHARDVMVLVDAVQVPGQMPMDVKDWEADFVAAAGHKWLMGPWGAGFLYVDAAVADQLEPAHIGYRSVREPAAADYELKTGAPRFEVGTRNPSTYVGLIEAMEGLESVGRDAIADEIQRLTDRFKAGIPESRLRSPMAYHSGLVSIEVGNPDEVVEQLSDANIQIRALTMPETVRLSFHAVNTAEEVDAAIEALENVWT